MDLWKAINEGWEGFLARTSIKIGNRQITKF